MSFKVLLKKNILLVCKQYFIFFELILYLLIFIGI